MYTCPAEVIAILIHDYPIETEKHPLPKLLLEALSGGHEYTTKDQASYLREHLHSSLDSLRERKLIPK